MFGLLLRALQAYALTGFGGGVWRRALLRAGFAPHGFEPLLSGRSADFYLILKALSFETAREPEALLEDLGLALISGPHSGGLRRLLRVGGADFREFLMSLPDWPGRARLALPDLLLPAISVSEERPGQFVLMLSDSPAQRAEDAAEAGASVALLSPLLKGLLCAIADDYGALVLTGAPPPGLHGGILQLTLADSSFAPGRDFDFSAGALQGVAG